MQRGAPMEADLGPVIGEYRSRTVRHRDVDGRIVQRAASWIIAGIIGVGALLAMLIVGVVLWLLFSLVSVRPSYAYGTTGQQAEKQLPWSCQQVRQFVAFATPEQIETVVSRLTRAQRRQAVACLKERQ